MKKLLFILTFCFTCAFFTIPALAVTTDQAGYLISYKTTTGYISLDIINYKFDHWSNSDLVGNGSDNYFWYGEYVFNTTFSYPDYSIPDVVEYAENYISNHALIDTNQQFTGGLGNAIIKNWKYYVANFPQQRYLPDDIDLMDIGNPPAPPLPDPGEPDFFDKVWNYVKDILGIDDDFSDEIEDYVTSAPGQAGHVQIVTPSPTPSPTPQLITIYDDNGDPAYSLTINGGDTINNNGSDFDIFDVDMKIGDGGSANPRDGLNSVMQSNNDYLNEEVDISAVQASVSLIPGDLFMLIGILGGIPIIAGFIGRLLKG